jgi:hypothetical protein
MKVLPEEPMIIRCTYSGKDADRTFDILIDDTVIATEILKGDRGRTLFHVDYAIPEALTSAKDKVTIKFAPHEGSTAGGVFGCAMMRKDSRP